MAGLADIVRSAVAVADTTTKSLQAFVIHKAWIGQGGFEFSYAPGVERRAIVEYDTELIQLASGDVVTTKASVTFLDPIPPNGAPGRREPVDTRDEIVLPDGTTGPILKIDGMINPDTQRPFTMTVRIGS